MRDGRPKPGTGSPRSTSSSPPGERFVYSDVGFLILGKLVERISGQPLDQFARDRIFRKLGMADAHFRPLLERAGEERMPAERIAPTERERAQGAHASRRRP